MKILSIDPGVERLGYAFISSLKGTTEYLSSGVVRTDKDDSPEIRIKTIFSRVEQLIVDEMPDYLVLEDLYFSKNVKTALSVARVQGVLLLLASQRNLKVSFLSPTRIKSLTTGYGFSDKKNVTKMINLVLHVDTQGKLDDEVDAIACGYAFSLSLHQVLQ